MPPTPAEAEARRLARNERAAAGMRALRAKRLAECPLHKPKPKLSKEESYRLRQQRKVERRRLKRAAASAARRQAKAELEEAAAAERARWEHDLELWPCFGAETL